jgi:rubredoxin
MWLLFHHGTKTRAVPDGDTFVDTCPECGKRARFHEIEVSESVGMFFVDLVDDKQRKYRCGACGDVFDLRDREATPPPEKTLAEREREQLHEREQKKQLAEAKAVRVEDELAELKKRMGK